MSGSRHVITLSPHNGSMAPSTLVQLPVFLRPYRCLYCLGRHCQGQFLRRKGCSVHLATLSITTEIRDSSKKEDQSSGKQQEVQDSQRNVTQKQKGPTMIYVALLPRSHYIKASLRAKPQHGRKDLTFADKTDCEASLQTRTLGTWVRSDG